MQLDAVGAVILALLSFVTGGVCMFLLICRLVHNAREADQQIMNWINGEEDEDDAA